MEIKTTIPKKPKGLQYVGNWNWISTLINTKYFDLEFNLDLRAWGIIIGVDDMFREYSLYIQILCFGLEFVIKPHNYKRKG